MKLVVAVIKPHMVESVTEALHSLDVPGITVTEARGHGRQRGQIIPVEKTVRTRTGELGDDAL